jgi:hypothetical protein
MVLMAGDFGELSRGRRILADLEGGKRWGGGPARQSVQQPLRFSQIHLFV